MSDLNAESVVVPRWALEFVLYRYRHGVAWRDGATGTAEAILQNCLETQQSARIADAIRERDQAREEIAWLRERQIDGTGCAS